MVSVTMVKKKKKFFSSIDIIRSTKATYREEETPQAKAGARCPQSVPTDQGEKQPTPERRRAGGLKTQAGAS